MPRGALNIFEIIGKRLEIVFKKRLQGPWSSISPVSRSDPFVKPEPVLSAKYSIFFFLVTRQGYIVANPFPDHFRFFPFLVQTLLSYTLTSRDTER